MTLIRKIEIQYFRSIYWQSITDVSELNKLLPLQLLECNKLEDSYIQLKYKVL